MRNISNRLKMLEKKLHPTGAVIWPYLPMLYVGEWCKILPTVHYDRDTDPESTPPSRALSADQLAVLAKFGLQSPYQLGDVICHLDKDNNKQVNIFPYYPYQTPYWHAYTNTLKKEKVLPDEKHWRSPSGKTMKDRKFGVYHLSNPEAEME